MNIESMLLEPNEKLSSFEMAIRAFFMFFIALLLIRFGGMRIFGKKSAFDSIIVIIMGAVLARGIVGASSYAATVIAATVMILINRILAVLSVKYKFFNNLMKGKALLLYEHGEIIWENMRQAALSKSDLMESLRLETNQDALGKIDRAYMETNGRISFVLKEQLPGAPGRAR